MSRTLPPAELGVWAQMRRQPTWRRRLGFLLGRGTTHWCRVVMDHTTRRFVEGLGPETLDTLEVSGDAWQVLPFGSYRAALYPDYDVCAGPLADQAFDLVIAEQVFEHVLDPAAAARHAFTMLRPGGWLVVTTPFLIRLHPMPYDVHRWTETGITRLLVGAGFPETEITTGSWGNRRAVAAHLDRWVRYRPLWHSLVDEGDVPLVVWAFARKPGPA